MSLQTQYLVISEADTPRESCTSRIHLWVTIGINNPLISHCFLFTMALKGINWETAKPRRVSFVCYASAKTSLWEMTQLT